MLSKSLPSFTNCVLFKKFLANSLFIRQMTSGNSPVAGKVAIISGGAIGIGLALAKAILQCGGKGIMLGDVREKEGKAAVCELNKKYGEGKLCFIKQDVTVPADNEKIFKITMDKFKQIDIVINNAGLLQDKFWRKEIDVNISGLVHGTLLGFDYMGKHKKGKGGVIINIASIYGLQQAHGCPVYNGSKYFVIGFSRAMGHEYYGNMTGVKVLTMCPGVTATNMIDEAASFGLEGFGDLGQILRDGLADLPSQPPEACGSCLIKMMCDGENGGIWVIEKSECYKVRLPDRQTLRVKS